VHRVISSICYAINHSFNVY
ncbi:hypothetical protein GWI33_005241, partial [Rhynchophorus ferrugineus]